MGHKTGGSERTPGTLYSTQLPEAEHWELRGHRNPGTMRTSPTEPFLWLRLCQSVYRGQTSAGDGGPHLLTQVEESIFQVSLDLLLDALQHVIGAVALVPVKY